tara:strand:+ start:474 stop:812 length:339 start_codon:yes stop_codon:yes gene_type:complete
MFLYSVPVCVFALELCLHKAGNCVLLEVQCTFSTVGGGVGRCTWWLKRQAWPRLHLPWMKKWHIGLCCLVGCGRGLCISISFDLPHEIEITMPGAPFLLVLFAALFEDLCVI